MSRAKTVLLWVVTVVLGLIFLVIGSSKLTQSPGQVALFEGFGYPVWFMLVIGVIEAAGAIALFVPRLARYGAAAIIPVMLGAAFSHVRAGEWPNPLFNLLFAAGLWWIARSRAPR